jgi:Protein of unknown function DUF262/Protein of unknown function (DUF1524)
VGAAVNRKVAFQTVKFTSQDRSLRQILASSYFYVPRYQRPYSWTRDNVDDLWADAIENNDGDNYFIGSMVVHPKPGSDDTMAVIDGQQRLATLLMILCAVREAADEQGLTKLASGTHNVVERRDEDDNPRFVLLAETSRKFLDDHVLARGPGQLGGPDGAEQEAIAEAYERIQTAVHDFVQGVTDDSAIKPAQKPRVIEQWLEGVRKKTLGLRVVFVEAAGHDDATTVFVTLNSRGKDLEPADLVKAQLLQLLPKTSGLDAPLERWQRIIAKFDASQADIEMTDFLLVVWRSRYGPTTRKALDKDVRTTIKKPHADAFLAELTDDSERYRQVVEPSYRHWNKNQTQPRDSLQFFLSFGIRQPRPLLLSLLRAFDAKRISYAQLRRASRAIEDYHFTFNVLAGKSSSGGMSAFYVKRALALEAASSKQRRAVVIDELIAELKSRRPSDDEFDAAFSDLWFTDDYTADKKQIQYVLRRVYEHQAPKAVVDFDKFTIEHLVPQSGKGDELGKLGNLIYVSETLNSALGNKSFGVKKPLLEKAKEWVPPEVLAAARWNDNAIESRTIAMSQEARSAIWAG